MLLNISERAVQVREHAVSIVAGLGMTHEIDMLANSPPSSTPDDTHLEQECVNDSFNQPLVKYNWERPELVEIHQDFKPLWTVCLKVFPDLKEATVKKTHVTITMLVTGMVSKNRCLEALNPPGLLMEAKDEADVEAKLSIAVANGMEKEDAAKKRKDFASSRITMFFKGLKQVKEDVEEKIGFRIKFKTLYSKRHVTAKYKPVVAEAMRICENARDKLFAGQELVAEDFIGRYPEFDRAVERNSLPLFESSTKDSDDGDDESAKIIRESYRVHVLEQAPEYVEQVKIPTIIVEEYDDHFYNPDETVGHDYNYASAVNQTLVDQYSGSQDDRDQFYNLDDTVEHDQDLVFAVNQTLVDQYSGSQDDEQVVIAEITVEDNQQSIPEITVEDNQQSILDVIVEEDQQSIPEITVEDDEQQNNPIVEEPGFYDPDITSGRFERNSLHRTGAMKRRKGRRSLPDRLPETSEHELLFKSSSHGIGALSYYAPILDDDVVDL